MARPLTAPKTRLCLKQPAVLLVVLLLTGHSFLMNGHKHVYRYLTVGTYLDPIAADAYPDLLKKSIFVQAVKRTNVRLCLSYDLYPWIYRNFDFEKFIIAQELISLFFMLWALVTLGRNLCGSSMAGCVTALLYTQQLNYWTLGSPAPYLNFFHHGLPYNYPLLAWSLVFFLKKRYAPSLVLAGLAWNFHPMCTVFLLFVYFIYGLLSLKEFPPAKIAVCLAAFVVPALPILSQAFAYTGNTATTDALWYRGVLWGAAYTCYPATWPAEWIVRAGLFFVVFVIALARLPGAADRRAIAIIVGAIGLLCFTGTVFADIYPVPFIIRLSLWRSTLIYLLAALPCIAGLVCTLAGRSKLDCFAALITLAILTGYVGSLNVYYLPAAIVYLALSSFGNRLPGRLSALRRCAAPLCCLLLGVTAAVLRLKGAPVLPAALFLGGALLLVVPGFCGAVKAAGRSGGPNRAWLIPLMGLVVFDLCVLTVRGGPEIYYHGRVRGKPDPWADVQIAARKHSSKDALFIIPPYLNDFGIYSQRATLGDWPEGGNIIYLDRQFAKEWFERMEAIGWKERFGAETGYNALTKDEILAAGKKYGAGFVVTEKPKTFDLEVLYENSRFVLYRLGESRRTVPSAGGVQGSGVPGV